MEEVWQAIQAGKAGERGPTEPVTLGNFLQSVGVDMPSAVSSDFNLASLSHLQEEAKVTSQKVPQHLKLTDSCICQHVNTLSTWESKIGCGKMLTGISTKTKTLR